MIYRRCGPGSVVGVATGLRAGRFGNRIPVGARFSTPVKTGPVAHPASCTMGTASFPGVKSGRSVTLTPHPLLVPWSRKSTVIPLFPLWTVRPVQSLSACTRVHFTFTLHLRCISLVLFSLLTHFLFYVFIYCNLQYDRLCGLVVRVSGYRYRGPGFDPRRYQIF